MLFQKEDLRPLSEMPIWARLKFAEMVPKTYFWNENLTDPRHPAEAEITGFVRINDTVVIYYTLEWLDHMMVIDGVKVTPYYIWPAHKFENVV